MKCVFHPYKLQTWYIPFWKMKNVNKWKLGLQGKKQWKGVSIHCEFLISSANITTFYATYEPSLGISDISVRPMNYWEKIISQLLRQTIYTLLKTSNSHMMEFLLTPFYRLWKLDFNGLVNCTLSQCLRVTDPRATRYSHTATEWDLLCSTLPP